MSLSVTVFISPNIRSSFIASGSGLSPISWPSYDMKHCKVMKAVSLDTYVYLNSRDSLIPFIFDKIYMSGLSQVQSL